MGAPGRGRRARPRRAVCDHRHRDGLGQVACAYLLPSSATSRATRPAPRGHHALPVADQGARRRPAPRAARPRLARRARRRRTTATPRRRARAGSAQHANYVLTNPDMLHRSLLPGHARWSPFLRGLRYVIIDEATATGASSARTSRRCCAGCAGCAPRYGADPTFVLASATVVRARAPRVAGSPACRSPRSTTTPRPAGAADLRALGAAAAPSCAASTARPCAAPPPPRPPTCWPTSSSRACRHSRSSGPGAAPSPWRSAPSAPCAEVAPRLARAGRRLPRGLPARGATRARGRPALRRAPRPRLAPTPSNSASTSPGSTPSSSRLARHPRVALAAGRPRRPLRAGAPSRCWSRATTRSTPTSSTTPRRSSARPVEATVLDPDNPYVLAPHLCAAAAELPLTEDDLALFGPRPPTCSPDLVRRGLLRRRPAGWYWTRRERATDLADIRGAGGEPVQVVEDGHRPPPRHRGRGVRAHAPSTTAPSTCTRARRTSSHDARPRRLASRSSQPADPDYSDDRPRRHRHRDRGPAPLDALGRRHRCCFGTVEVTQPGRRLPDAAHARRARCWARSRSTSRRAPCAPAPSGGRSPTTRSPLWTTGRPGRVRRTPPSTPSIGLLPLFATCDRWDIGGVSTALHPDTGLLTVFVYDGHEGGAGFAERGYAGAARLAPRHPRRDRGLRVRGRLPVVHPVAEVRQRQRPPRQARRR